MNKLRFEKTCSACPEQYDVFKGSKQVGYIRLRHGILSCRYPNNRGKEIYIYEFADEWKGCFNNDKERNFYLNKCSNALLKEIKEHKIQVRK